MTTQPFSPRGPEPIPDDELIEYLISRGVRVNGSYLQAEEMNDDRRT